MITQSDSDQNTMCDNLKTFACIQPTCCAPRECPKRASFSFFIPADVLCINPYILASITFFFSPKSVIVGSKGYYLPTVNTPVKYRTVLKLLFFTNKLYAGLVVTARTRHSYFSHFLEHNSENDPVTCFSKLSNCTTKVSFFYSFLFVLIRQRWIIAFIKDSFFMRPTFVQIKR